MTDAGELPGVAEKAPCGATGKAAEYLEKLLAENFKRELDQEENVVRSLPFFATSIGVLVAFIGLARPTLPAFGYAFWPILVYTLMGGVIISLAALIIFLYLAVRQRTFDYPMNETDLIIYAKNLTEYYRKILTTEDATEKPKVNEEIDPLEVVERVVIDDIRTTMMDQVAKSARISRANNWARLKARTRAFTALMTALSFALLLIVAILIHDALYGGPHGQGNDARPGVTDPNRTGP